MSGAPISAQLCDQMPHALCRAVCDAVVPGCRTGTLGDRANVCAECIVAGRYWPEEHADSRCAGRSEHLVAFDRWRIGFPNGHTVTVVCREHYEERIAA